MIFIVAFLFIKFCRLLAFCKTLSELQLAIVFLLMSDSSPMGSHQLPLPPQLDDTCVPCMWTIQKDGKTIKHSNMMMLPMIILAMNVAKKTRQMIDYENNGESSHKHRMPYKTVCWLKEGTPLLTHMYRGAYMGWDIYGTLWTARNQEMDHRSWVTMLRTMPNCGDNHRNNSVLMKVASGMMPL